MPESDQLETVVVKHWFIIKLCSVSAVRFIGTYQPSIAIEDDVSIGNMYGRLRARFASSCISRSDNAINTVIVVEIGATLVSVCVMFHDIRYRGTATCN